MRLIDAAGNELSNDGKAMGHLQVQHPHCLEHLYLLQQALLRLQNDIDS